MYAVVDHELPPPPPAADALSRELQRILEMRASAIDSRELLYSSPIIRSLIEDEIPRLITLAVRGR